MTVNIIYIDMDDTLCDFTRSYLEHIERTPEIQYPQSQYGFFARLRPLPGAVESVKALIESKFYEPYILTAPSTRNPFSYTEKRVWVEEQFGYALVQNLIICSNKSLLKGNYLVDDNDSGKGQDGFSGELLHFGSERFPHWAAVMKYLGVPLASPSHAN